jgi:putative spermidine/putrescine transport system permease protein
MSYITIGNKRISQLLGRQQRNWLRYITLVTLLSPAIFLLSFPFITSMLLLFSYSAYQFDGIQIQRIITFESYYQFGTDIFYWDILGRTLWLATQTTLITLIIGYPIAYAVSRLHNQRLKILLYVLIFSPLLTSIVTRVFGWIILLGRNGFVNFILLNLKIVDEPVSLIYNIQGVLICMVHIYLPFAIFPLLSVLNQIDPVLKEAASDLGCGRWQVFKRVTWPLSIHGLLVAAQITFIQAVSAFVAPQLLGGGRVIVLPRLIYDSITSLNWPMASVQSIVLLIISLTILFLSHLMVRTRHQATGV